VNFQNDALFDIGIRDVRGNSAGFKNIQGQPENKKAKDIKLSNIQNQIPGFQILNQAQAPIKLQGDLNAGGQITAAGI